MTGFAAMIDELYSSVSMDPARWNKATITEWAEALAEGDAPTRDESRHIRRSLRIAQKMRQFWVDADESLRSEMDWRARVDVAVGVPAWRPTLALAEIELQCTASEEAFDDVVARFRLVHNAPFAGGMGYGDWLASREE